MAQESTLLLIRQLMLKGHHLRSMTGIIHLVTTLCGQHLIKSSQSTTHVHPIGVFPTAVATVCGKRLDSIRPTTAQIEEFHSASVRHQRPGTLLRVIALATLAVSPMPVNTASFGLRLLTAKTRAACTSTKLATYFRRPTTAHAASLSVASKKSTKLLERSFPC